MRISEPTAAHVRHVAENMRAKDAAEFLAVTFDENPSQLAERMVQMYSAHPGSYAFSLDDGTPVAVGAMVEGRPNVVTLMFFATDDFSRIALPLAKWTTRDLFPRYRAEGIHRIECIAIDGYVENHKWIRLIGLEHEAEMPKFGKGGETFHQFSWVA